MIKTKKQKPVRAWALVGRDGAVWPRLIYPTRESARFHKSDYPSARIVHVEITIVKK